MPSNSLDTKLEEIFTPQIPGDTCPECYTNFPDAISKLKALFESELQEAERREWQRIYDYFEAIDPHKPLEHPESPRLSVLSELRGLAPKEPKA